VVAAESFFSDSGVSFFVDAENARKPRHLCRSLATKSSRCRPVINPLCDRIHMDRWPSKGLQPTRGWALKGTIATALTRSPIASQIPHNSSQMIFPISAPVPAPGLSMIVRPNAHSA
jgi:hypothetical protein